MVPVIFIALAGVITYNWLAYLTMKAKEEDDNRPPIIDRMEDDLILTERDGRTVRLSELREQLLIVSWVYTRCPRGCAGVVAKLKTLQEELGSEVPIHFISLTLDPEDTPEMMKAFADQVGIADDAPWWFVNGESETVRDYMVRVFRFRPVQTIPEEDRLSSEDKYMHDLRVALVDHKGHVRRLADILNADPEIAAYWDQRLRDDIQYLLKDREEEMKSNPVSKP